MILIMTAGSWMVLAGTLIRNAFAMTAFHALMRATWKRRKWSIGTRTDFSKERRECNERVLGNGWSNGAWLCAVHHCQVNQQEVKGGRHGSLACLCGRVRDYWRDRRDCVRHSEEVIYRVGVGEGLAAVRGYQSGIKGVLAGMPAFSREIEMVCGLSVRFSAPTLLVNR